MNKHILVSAITGFITALATVTLVNSTTNNSPTTFLSNTTDGAMTEEPVSVTRSDIRSQFTLNATVVHNPTFLILSDSDGTVAHTDSVGLIDEGVSVGSVSDTAILAPRQIELLRWLVPNGSTVSSGTPIAEVRLVGFAVEADVEASDSYQLLAGSEITGRASIDVGPGPFDCPVVQPSDVEESDTNEANLTVTILCLIPDDVRSVTDVPATLLVTNAIVKDALILPVTAVSGLVDTGEVLLLEDGSTIVRPVELGITDGVHVEIRSGLEEGNEVAAKAPPLQQP